MSEKPEQIIGIVAETDERRVHRSIKISGRWLWLSRDSPKHINVGDVVVLEKVDGMDYTWKVITDEEEQT